MIPSSSPTPITALFPFPDLPAPSQQPEHENDFPEEHDEGDPKVNFGKQQRAQFMDHPTQAIDKQQDADIFRFPAVNKIAVVGMGSMTN